MVALPQVRAAVDRIVADVVAPVPQTPAESPQQAQQHCMFDGANSVLASEQLMYYWPQAYAQLQQLFADVRAALVALQPPPVDPKKGV